jgi:hypothetical protein
MLDFRIAFPLMSVSGPGGTFGSMLLFLFRYSIGAIMILAQLYSTGSVAARLEPGRGRPKHPGLRQEAEDPFEPLLISNRGAGPAGHGGCPGYRREGLTGRVLCRHGPSQYPRDSRQIDGLG